MYFAFTVYQLAVHTCLVVHVDPQTSTKPITGRHVASTLTVLVTPDNDDDTVSCLTLGHQRLPAVGEKCRATNCNIRKATDGGVPHGSVHIQEELIYDAINVATRTTAKWLLKLPVHLLLFVTCLHPGRQFNHRRDRKSGLMIQTIVIRKINYGKLINDLEDTPLHCVTQNFRADRTGLDIPLG